MEPGAQPIVKKKRGRPRKGKTNTESQLGSEPMSVDSEMSTVPERTVASVHFSQDGDEVSGSSILEMSDRKRNRRRNKKINMLESSEGEGDISHRSEEWEDMKEKKERDDRQEFTTGSSAYEILGFQSAEPASRPPVLKVSSQARPYLSWAAADCMRSMNFLRRARPQRSIAANFYDRLEVLRRVL